MFSAAKDEDQLHEMLLNELARTNFDFDDACTYEEQAFVAVSEGFADAASILRAAVARDDELMEGEL